MSIPTLFNAWIYFCLHLPQNFIFRNVMYNIYDKLWRVKTSSPHPVENSEEPFKKCFQEIWETSQFNWFFSIRFFIIFLYHFVQKCPLFMQLWYFWSGIKGNLFCVWRRMFLISLRFNISKYYFFTLILNGIIYPRSIWGLFTAETLFIYMIG